MAAPGNDPELDPVDHDDDADSTIAPSEAATDPPAAPMRTPAETRLYRKDMKDLIDMATKYATTYKHLLDSPYLEDFVKLQAKLAKPLAALYEDAPADIITFWRFLLTNHVAVDQKFLDQLTIPDPRLFLIRIQTATWTEQQERIRLKGVLTQTTLPKLTHAAMAPFVLKIEDLATSMRAIGSETNLLDHLIAPGTLPAAAAKQIRLHLDVDDYASAKKLLFRIVTQAESEPAPAPAPRPANLNNVQTANGGNLQAGARSAGRTPLDENERKRCIAESRCFVCRNQGHRAAECPHSSKNKPQVNNAQLGAAGAAPENA